MNLHSMLSSGTGEVAGITIAEVSVIFRETVPEAGGY
jgi:hypothetical protein